MLIGYKWRVYRKMISTWSERIAIHLDATKDECLKAIGILEEDGKNAKYPLTANLILNLKNRLILLIASINRAIQDEDDDDMHYYINLEDRAWAMYLMTKDMEDKLLPITMDIEKHETVARLMLDFLIAGLNKCTMLEKLPNDSAYIMGEKDRRKKGI
jgi:hypothetical protein